MDQIRGEALILALESRRMPWSGCWKVIALEEALIVVIRFWYTKELKYVVCALFHFSDTPEREIMQGTIYFY